MIKNSEGKQTPINRNDTFIYKSKASMKKSADTSIKAFTPKIVKVVDRMNDKNVNSAKKKYKTTIKTR